MAQLSAPYADESLVNADITLTNCDREPIHRPGHTQPYGFLLCLDEQTQRVVQASANTQQLLGRPAETLIGAGLEQLLGPEQLAEVVRRWPTLTEAPQLVGVRLDLVAGQPLYKLILHRYDQLLWVEGEPVDAAGASVLNLPALNLTLDRLLTASTTLAMCQAGAEQVRALTGFDRVAVYRFAPDESGEIVAEATRPDLEPWLGLHYPATDIPQQARAMYLKNWLRFIPDVAYVPVPLVPAFIPGSTRQPDMTYAVLRSVSPIHLEYLRNMGTAATMTISLIEDGRLWGMITCHHESPRLVSYELRDLCQFLGKTISALLKTKQLHDELMYRQRIKAIQGQLFELVNVPENAFTGLHRFSPTLLDMFDCGGAAIYLDDTIVTLGNTPPRHQIANLVGWLRTHNHQPVFHTDSYVLLNPLGHGMRDTASGIMALTLAPEQDEYIIWFRPEMTQTVTWAGRQEKPQVLADGQLFLSTRQSFEAWQQTVEYTAAPWQAPEIEAATELRRHLVEVRLRAFSELQTTAVGLAHLNRELERSNDELDSFAYVASHDLKEPLRGIHNYAVFLLEDYAAQLDAEGVSKLQTLVRLSQRMEALIEALLQMARVGRLELDLEETDLNEALTDILDLLQPRLEQTHSTVTVTGALPTLYCDSVRIREIFNNLLTNAMRYNNNPTKQISVGLAAATVRGPNGTGDPADFHVFYVRDNGIGIAPRHHANIFKLFKRLHAQDKYGGGTGAGLAIAKRMVEKHSGELWVDSALGLGATFYFSLSRHL